MEGNQMKMRETLRVALEKVNETYDVLSKSCIVVEEARQACREARGVLIPALAKPPRQCDVGTPEEQNRRFERYCDSEVCECKMCKNVSKYLVKSFCALAWAQMPYEAEEGAGE